MPYRRTTLSKFIIEDQRRAAAPETGLTSLLNDIQTACKLIAVAAARGVAAEELKSSAHDIMVGTCEWGGQLAGMVSAALTDPYEIPGSYPTGRYLLVFDPLDGSSNVDVNMPVGTIFSVLRCPADVTRPSTKDFLQPGTAQVAAGYAIYGPTTMMVLTTGDGTNGFTLDPEIGAFILTHPAMSVPPASHEFAVDSANARFWEPPVRRYVDECVEGAAGPRGADCNMRWIASTVAEAHRILLRGGVFMVPRDTGSLRLLQEASPMAMVITQAGGAASTGRENLLDLIPDSIHQHVPVLLGSRDEVARLVRYHGEHDRGEDTPFRTPLFNARSLFRTV